MARGILTDGQMCAPRVPSKAGGFLTDIGGGLGEDTAPSKGVIGLYWATCIICVYIYNICMYVLVGRGGIL